MNTEQKLNLMKTVLDTLADAVASAGPDGIPAGHLYAHLMAMGCEFRQFEAIMGALVKAGRITKRGHLYLPPSTSNGPVGA